MSKQKIIMIEGGGGKDINDVSRERKSRGFSKTYLEDFMKAGLSIHLIRGIKDDLEKDNIVIESWKTVKSNKPLTLEIDKIKHRIFPSHYLYGFDFSPYLLKELKNEIKNNQIIIHSHLYHTPLLWIILFLFGKDVPIVYSHHGGLNPKLKWIEEKNIKNFIINIMLSLEYYVEKITFKNIDYFRPLTTNEKDYLVKITDKHDINLSIGFGLDTSIFKPIDKEYARRKLGLLQDTKILLYVGHAYKPKGVDIILQVYEKIKEKDRVELIILGASKSDELYEIAIQKGAKVYNWIDRHTILPLFYNAADIYVLPVFKPHKKYGSKLIYSGGPGIALLEVLSCGTPAVSTALIHLPNDEWKKCGLVPRDPTDTIRCVEEILENPTLYNGGRNVVEKYYSWKAVKYQLYENYNRLFNLYYGLNLFENNIYM